MNTAFQIEGGTRPELEAILYSNHHFGHFVHPVALESGSATAVIRGHSAIFYRDDGDTREYAPHWVMTRFPCLSGT